MRYVCMEVSCSGRMLPLFGQVYVEGMSGEKRHAAFLPAEKRLSQDDQAVVEGRSFGKNTLPQLPRMFTPSHAVGVSGRESASCYADNMLVSPVKPCRLMRTSYIVR